MAVAEYLAQASGFPSSWLDAPGGSVATANQYLADPLDNLFLVYEGKELGNPTVVMQGAQVTIAKRPEAARIVKAELVTWGEPSGSHPLVLDIPTGAGSPRYVSWSSRGPYGVPHGSIASGGGSWSSGPWRFEHAANSSVPRWQGAGRIHGSRWWIYETFAPVVSNVRATIAVDIRTRVEWDYAHTGGSDNLPAESFLVEMWAPNLYRSWTASGSARSLDVTLPNAGTWGLRVIATTRYPGSYGADITETGSMTTTAEIVSLPAATVAIVEAGTDVGGPSIVRWSWSHPEGKEQSGATVRLFGPGNVLLHTVEAYGAAKWVKMPEVRPLLVPYTVSVEARTVHPEYGGVERAVTVSASAMINAGVWREPSITAAQQMVDGMAAPNAELRVIDTNNRFPFESWTTGSLIPKALSLGGAGQGPWRWQVWATSIETVEVPVSDGVPHSFLASSHSAVTGLVVWDTGATTPMTVAEGNGGSQLAQVTVTPPAGALRARIRLTFQVGYGEVWGAACQAAIPAVEWSRSLDGRFPAYIIERSSTGGSTWAAPPVSAGGQPTSRDPVRVGPQLDRVAIDPTAPPLPTVWRAVPQWVTAFGEPVTGPVSAPTYPALRITGSMSVTIMDPSLPDADGVVILEFNAEAEWETEGDLRSTVHQPRGQRFPVVLTETVSPAESGEFHLIFRSRAAYDKFEELRLRQRPLLFSSDIPGERYWVQMHGRRRVRLGTGPGAGHQAVWLVTIPWVQVAPPSGFEGL